VSKQPAKRVSPKLVDTLFNISKSELISELIEVVEKATEAESIVDLKIKIEFEKQGHQGEKSASVISTFCYQTVTSATGEITIFVKRIHASDTHERDDYLAFAQVGIPTPKYYGHLINPKGEEILFLEFLPDIGIDLQNAFEIRAWIGLLAQISATRLPFSHFILPEIDLNKKSTADFQWWKPTLKRIWQVGSNGEIGLSIQSLCLTNPHAVPMISDYGVAVEKRVAGMKRGLCQGDACVQNVGWRTGKQEIVVFDLGFSVGPRFYDISNVMSALSESVLSQREITTYFLAQYAKWGGRAISLGAFLSEVAWLSDVRRLWCLPWYLEMSLSGRVDWTDNTEAGKQAFQHWLYDGLDQLLQSAKRGQPPKV